MDQKSAKDMVVEASQEVETLSGEDALKLVDQPNVVFVDVREGEELQKAGKLKGAVHVPRGSWSSTPTRRALRISPS